MPAHQPAIGDPVLAGALYDEEEVVVTVGYDAVSRSLRDDYVVACGEREGTVVGLESPASPVHEVTDVTVCVAQKVRHRLGPAADEQTNVVVAGDQLPRGARVDAVLRLHLIEIKCTRAQRPFDASPRGRRVRPVQVRGPAEEGLAAALFPVRPLRNPHVGLLGDLAFGEDEVHYRFPLASCSRSIASNRALKLPAPKPLAPWRSITS